MIEIIAIRSYPDNPKVPDKIVSHIDEGEMKTCFIDGLELDLFRTQDELTACFINELNLALSEMEKSRINELNLALSEMEKSRKFYQWNRLTREEYVELVKKILLTREEYVELVKKILLTREEYLEAAKKVLTTIKEKYLEIGAKNFGRMLKTIKIRTRVRVKP